MKKKIVKYVIYLLFATFLFYFLVGDKMYQDDLMKRKNLTEEQIKKFEEDIKNGVEIDLNEYVVKEKDYSNSVTKINGKISSLIEKGFKKVFEYFLSSLDL